MLAIAGGKGGCGKTTTTACLARSLADQGHEPIAVDGDCDMPDLHVVAGSPAEPGLADYRESTALADVATSAVELPGVSVIPAVDADTEDLENALVDTRPRSSPLIVDTPAGASPPVATALEAADETVIVTTATRESLEDAAKTAAMARALDTNVLGSIVTKSDGAVDPTGLLGCETLAHVPSVAEPMRNELVSNRYDTVATLVNKHNI